MDRPFYAQIKEGKYLGNTIPHMDYRQYQRVQGLVHQCCNYVDGNCLLLDDGWEPCICVQSISRSLICKYFRAAVLPLDRELETALLYKRDSKRCCRCGAPFGLRQSVRPKVQPGEILSRLRRCCLPPAKGRERTSAQGRAWTIRSLKALCHGAFGVVMGREPYDYLTLPPFF